MALDQTFSKSVNDFLHGVSASNATSLPQVTGRKVKLITTATPSTATTSGSEVTASGGYTSGGVAITYTAATTATPSVSSNAVVTITNMPATTVGGIDLYSTDTTPLRIEYGALTASKTVNSGDTLSFTAGSITSSLS